MTPDKKNLFTFTVNRKVEKSKTETTTDESGATISKTVKELVDEPVEVIIKRPNRRQEEEADEEYAVEVARLTKRGLLTKAMLVKQYSDVGGWMSKDEAKQCQTIDKELASLETEYQKISAFDKKTKKNNDRIEELAGKIIECRRKLLDFESRHQTLFEQTVENKAQAKLIQWYILNLVSLKEGEKQTPLYPGETYEEKLESFFAKEEEADEFYSQVQRRLYLVVAVWFYNKSLTSDALAKTIESIEKGDL